LACCDILQGRHGKQHDNDSSTDLEVLKPLRTNNRSLCRANATQSAEAREKGEQYLDERIGGAAHVFDHEALFK
jgi:hypothetical protein